jgi:hypothetical protein
MLILSLKRHFPARFPEWHNAGILTTWGAYLVVNPEIMTSPATAALWTGLTDMTPIGYSAAALWGMLALVVGLLRACALFINGAFTRTPMIRLAASFISAFIWTQVVIGLVKTGIPNTGLVVYSWLVVADLVSAYRASCDMVYAEKQRRDLKSEMGDRAEQYGGVHA